MARAGIEPAVAVFGTAGLGHLALQFSAAMGYRTIAIARGSDREPLARALGTWPRRGSLPGTPDATIPAPRPTERP